ncbi:hypothetical protein GCM10020295_30940 [Streptomyces cinereospinus]
MSLVELIAQADERGLTVSALACLDRCVPLLGGDDEVLRPLWANLTDSGDAGEWGALLDAVRGQLGVADVVAAEDVEDEAALLVRRMLAAAPRRAVRRRGAGLGRRLLGGVLAGPPAARPAEDGTAPVDTRREGGAEDMSPLVAAELRRQVTVLELLTGHGTTGLRRALEVSTQGRRVLRAVVSRRARHA